MAKHSDRVSPIKIPPLDDATSGMESTISSESTGKTEHIFRVFRFIFRTSKGMCLVFFSLLVLLSLLRPVLAFVWGHYVSWSELQDWEVFWTMLGLVLVYFCINFLISLLNRYLNGGEDIERLDIVQSNHFQENVNARLYEKISALSPEYMEVPKINDDISRVFSFVGDGWTGMNRSVMISGYQIAARVISVVSIALSLYFFHPLLCVIVLIAPIPILYTSFVQNKLSYKFIKDNSDLSRRISYFQSLLIGKSIKEIKTLHAFDFFFSKWKESSDEYIRKETKKQIRSSILGVISTTITNIASISANVFAIILMALGQISLGVLSSVMSLIGSLIGDMSGLFNAVGAFLSKKNECGQFCQLMDHPEQSNTGEAISRMESIHANHLYYRYPLTERYVLDDVSVTIHAGEKIALVGENGSGKSTFIKLISGMLEPSQGTLAINGKDAAAYSYESRYDAMSAVYQDPAQYNMFTVGDNVYLSDTHRPRDEARLDFSLKAAGFDGADKNALLGKDVGGTDLSGGQWQKLAIARAYYRDRNFIILDEPTGNLDPIAESEILKRYIDLAQERTLLIVTHRIGAASLADRILVFSGGRIVEDGSHAELLNQNGEYARLYHEQEKWYDR